MASWFSEGTVTVQNGSPTVTGVGTKFSNCRSGDMFVGPDQGIYQVINPASDTSLSISPAYRGAAVGGAGYGIVPVNGYPKALADAVNQMVQQWGATLAGLGDVSTQDVVPVAKGGTGGTTSSTARANLGLGTAAVAALVGAVSQAGGVPTGAVMQYGSNANGAFIRFADGTQICSFKMLAPLSVTSGPINSLYFSSLSWTFPAQFFAPPVAKCSPYSDGVIALALAGPTTTTTYSPGVASLTSIPSRAFVIDLIAIGRWYT